MSYFRLRPYGELELVHGRPLGPATQCIACGRVKTTGKTNLTVRFVDQPPYPDALGVLFGPEWAISEGMRALIDSALVLPPDYSPVRGEDGRFIGFHQVVLKAALRAGRESIRGGSACDVCGGYVQLALDPLFLKRHQGHEPPLAYLLESPGVILVREDVAARLSQAKLDIELVPAYFEGEQASSPY